MLAVLGDDEQLVAETLSSAVALAEDQHARLTLVKTCDEGRAYVCIAPFAFGAAYVPPAVDSPEEAARILAGFAEQVPACIPLTTLVLGQDTQRSLLELLRTGNFGAIVASADLISHCRRLRRALRREDLLAVPVTRDCRASSGGSYPGQFSANGGTEHEAPDAVQVPSGSGRRQLGVWARSGHRLAGAGGKR